MKNAYIEKINKLGNAGYVLSRICSVLLTVAAVACLAGGIILALVPENGIMVTTCHTAQIEMDMTNSVLPNLVGFDKENDGSFELNGIKYDQFEITNELARQTATAKSTPYRYSLKKMMWVFFTGSVMCFAMIYVFRNISALFNSFKACDTPFTTETAQRFKKLAISFVPIMIIGWVMDAVTKYITTGVLEFEIGIDISMVMVVVVMLMMSEIFRYGVMLQQEADETL